LNSKPVYFLQQVRGGQAAALASLEKLVGVFNPQLIQPGIAIKGTPEEADKAKAIEMGEKLADAVNKIKSKYIVA